MRCQFLEQRWRDTRVHDRVRMVFFFNKRVRLLMLCASVSLHCVFVLLLVCCVLILQRLIIDRVRTQFA